jgi:hypothetical protein
MKWQTLLLMTIFVVDHFGRSYLILFKLFFLFPAKVAFFVGIFPAEIAFLIFFR